MSKNIKENIDYIQILEQSSSSTSDIKVVEELQNNPISQPKQGGFNRVKGLFFMLLNVLFMGGSYILQKVLMAKGTTEGNPISPNEFTYLMALLILPMQICLMHKQNMDFFPIPQKVRFTYLIRCVVGMICNLLFLFSLNFIPFSKASVIFWTAPVFVAFFGHIFLNEHLSKYDWIAVFVAFIGILMIQNPFTQDVHATEFWNDLIGTLLALGGSITGALVAISIRTITNYAKLPFIVIPIGWVLGNLVLCPIFALTKILINPVDEQSLVPVETGEIGTSLHVYSLVDVIIIVSCALLTFGQQNFQAQAYRYEKAGRVAPFLYLQILFCCVSDFLIFETKLGIIQILGGLLILITNFTIALMKCFEFIS